MKTKRTTVSTVDSKTDQSVFFSKIGSYTNLMENRVAMTKKQLEGWLSSSESTYSIKLAGRYAGRKPGWHIENSLVRRAQRAGLGHMIQKYDALTSEDFEEQLLKAEKLMLRKINFTGDKRKLHAATFRVMKQCKFPNERFTLESLQYTADNHLNKSASAGYPYYKRKGLVIDNLVADASQILSGKKPFPMTYPTSRSFRLQQRYSKGNIKRKIRIMYPFPGVITLLEAYFGNPLVTHFKNTETFYCMGKNGEQIGNKILSVLGKHKNKITSTDIESFDQNMLTEVVLCAFYVLKSQLSLTQRESFLFDQMVSYFCTSIMVSKIKGSKVNAFVKQLGIPSGSFFTNILDTIANAICIEYCQPNLLDKALIMGDDNIFVSQHVNLDTYTRVMLTDLNLPISQDKTEHFESAFRVSFLGFTWLNGIRYVEPKLVINQCVWHTDFFTDMSLYDREIARCASTLLNGKNGKDIFTKMFPDVIKQLEMGVDVRFYYLNNYAPPALLPSVIQSFKSKINFSLKLHLEQGYLIR